MWLGEENGVWLGEEKAGRVVEPTSPPPNFDPDQALADVETIRALDPSVLCYAHFGPAKTADHLAEYERVLADWVDTVAAVREELGGDDADVDAVIETLVDRSDTAAIWNAEKAAAETSMNVRGVLHALERS